MIENIIIIRLQHIMNQSQIAPPLTPELQQQLMMEAQAHSQSQMDNNSAPQLTPELQKQLMEEELMRRQLIQEQLLREQLAQNEMNNPPKIRLSSLRKQQHVQPPMVQQNEEVVDNKPTSSIMSFLVDSNKLKLSGILAIVVGILPIILNLLANYINLPFEITIVSPKESILYAVLSFCIFYVVLIIEPMIL